METLIQIFAAIVIIPAGVILVFASLRLRRAKKALEAREYDDLSDEFLSRSGHNPFDDPGPLIDMKCTSRLAKKHGIKY